MNTRYRSTSANGMVTSGFNQKGPAQRFVAKQKKQKPKKEVKQSSKEGEDEEAETEKKTALKEEVDDKEIAKNENG